MNKIDRHPNTVRIGEIVHFFHGGSPSEKPLVMFVTDVNQNGMVKGNAISPQMANFKQLSGVRHMDDPAPMIMHTPSDGRWDFPPPGVTEQAVWDVIYDINSRVLHLEERLATLEGALK